MGDVIALLDYRGTFLFSVDVKYQSSIFTCWGHCDRCMAAAATVLLGRLQTTSPIILTGFTGVWWRNCPRMKHVCTTLYTMKGMPSILPICTAVYTTQCVIPAVADPRGGGRGLKQIINLFRGFLMIWCYRLRLREKQCPICLRLHEKAFGCQKFHRGRASTLLQYNIFLSNFTPPPLRKN